MLLKEIAATLRSGLRKSDMLARYTGDEFVVHLDVPSNDAKIISEDIALTISKLFEKPLSIGGHQVKAGVSIGIATFPQHGKDVSSLIHSADLAMYKAKKGKLPFVFYETDDSGSNVSSIN